MSHNRKIAVIAVLALALFSIGGSMIYWYKTKPDFEFERSTAAADCIVNKGYGAWDGSDAQETLEEFCNEVGWQYARQTLPP